MGVRKWEAFKTQKEWKDYLQELVKTNDRALVRAIWVIYQRQTAEEQLVGRSTEENGRGFSKIDAEFFTTIVVQLQHGKGLSARQMAISRNKMTKYWRQLMEVSKMNMSKAATESSDPDTT